MGMTLDEHIKKAEEDAAQAESDSDWGFGNYFIDRTEAVEYAENCRQLVGWLKDYKRLRKITFQPKMGKWITKSHGFPPEPTTVCSECGFDRDFYIRARGFDKIKYCPNCRARMVQPQESEDEE